jgi:UrcA family protein
MKIALISVVALVALAPSIASAETPAVRPAAALRYSDLDLSKAADAEVMLHRIREVAAAVCSHGDAGAMDRALRQDCYSKTVRDTVVRLNAPRLTAAYAPTAAATKLAAR